MPWEVAEPIREGQYEGGGASWRNADTRVKRPTSAKSLYYRAEDDQAVLKHRWIYPNEAEATDELVEMFRPLLSGGKASHLTVNKTGDGRNAALELNIEGPTS